MSGLNGDYQGSCIACLNGTDTGLVCDGDAEFAVAVLTCLGLPYDQAIAALGWTGQCPDGRVQVPVRVCAACAGRVGKGLPTGLVTGELPVVAAAGAGE